MQIILMVLILMDPMTAFETAQIGLGSASLLKEAFGSDSGNWRGKYYDNQMRDRTQYEPQLIEANKAASIAGSVRGAKEAGLHPLFALGASGGGSPSFQIPGQSPKGDFKAQGLQRALGGMANRRADKEIATMEIAASALRIAENNTGNDIAHGAVDKTVTVPVEIKSRAKDDSSQQAGVKPAWQKVEIIPGLNVSVPASDEGWAESLEGALPQVATLVKNTADLNIWLGKQGAQALKPYAKQIMDYYNRPSRPAVASKVVKNPSRYRKTMKVLNKGPYRPNTWR